MNKKIRQYIGLAMAVLMYYLIHEGAHLVVALAQGVFKRINFMGMPPQNKKTSACFSSPIEHIKK